ncbi:MAG: hypothetical protein BGO01_10510 [Armatimonadetes bacterium 55-13]|nr:chemotaxis protein CheA [Armatimonadota bacterium]OJU62829.1 MAG: hypothetical protein BGO01_10510 [Armatimonadetes bacterium 55-13]
MSIDVSMFQQAFFDEATELLNDLETQLLDLEERKADKELLNTIFRCAHSIKGGSATFGFPAIANFTHGLETLLDKVRAGSIPVTSEICSTLFESLDQMRALLNEAMGKGGPAPDSTELARKIDRLSECESRSDACSQAESEASLGERTYSLHIAPGVDVMRTGADPCRLLAQLLELAEVVDVERHDEGIPPLAEMDPEACYVSWDIKLQSTVGEAEILEVFEFIEDESDIRLSVIAETQQEAVVETPEMAQISVDKSLKADTAMLKVSADKVDRLVNLVGELVISQSMLNEAVAEIDFERHPRLFEAVSSMERASRELQERVMGIRLVQLKHALARFPRLVRDISGAVGKKIELVTIGEETELDKALIEAIGDPLTHLVRNAIDHGLETPSERKAAGKPEMGMVKIHARYEGGNVIIEITDDGRGLDRDKILEKAKAKGLVSEGEVLSDDAIYGFIFHPGFSTASQVTDLSGRGVGMDIVRQTIQGMNGSIGLSTEFGKGTTFRIRLPLTMAILEGLSLRIGEEIYILPLTSIVESLRPLREDLSLVAGRHEIIRVRGEVLRILRVHEAFDIQGAVTDPCEGLLVIVENEGNKLALLVDELITQNQAVIKSLEANYRKVEGITGATILGDGKVALIMDVPGLFRGTRMEAGRLLAS